MRRRALLGATTIAAFGAGCLDVGGCGGVALGIELNDPDTTDDAVLNFDAADLSAAERDGLERATGERVVGCTRDDIDALETVVERTAAHAGVTEHELYYTEGRARTQVRFQETRYQAVVVYDTAESSGGPLDA